MKTVKAPLCSILIGTCLFTLVSCGSDGGGGSSGSSSSSRQEEQQGDEGIYRAVFKPLNTSVSGNTSGTMEVRIEGDDFVVQNNITGSPSGAKHLQNIMLGNSCPTEASDKNGDGIIDIKEAMAVTGDILIPLDSKISDQLAGIEYGPIANGAGNYVYRRSASLTELLADLRAPDPDKFDSISKLPFGDRLNLSGKVVLIHGVSSRSEMEETAASVRELPVSQTLPIACGKLVRINSEDPSPETTPEATTISEESI